MRPAPESVAIIGAGPYGLAAAAHLRSAGLITHTFGQPMEFWSRHMPAGMVLRSRRRSTHIADPDRRLTIDAFEQAVGRRVHEPSLLLDEFIEYGLWFRREAVPDVDNRYVSGIRRDNGRFCVELADGEVLESARVVIAAGLAPFARMPEPFACLPRSVVSHASEHRDLGRFGGQRVVVVGGGQSALESAALLSEGGAKVEILARTPSIRWLPDPGAPAPRQRIPVPPPPTDVGGRLTGWIAATPDLFRVAPEAVQSWVADRCVRPAAAGRLRTRTSDLTVSCERFAVAAEPSGDGVQLILNDGSERVADQVLLATGYAVDVTRYPFIPGALAAQVERRAGYPLLGPGLESSVPGLHFVGAPAALSFGPIMRFVVGTHYAAPALTRCALRRRQLPLRFAF